MHGAPPAGTTQGGRAWKEVQLTHSPPRPANGSLHTTPLRRTYARGVSTHLRAGSSKRGLAHDSTTNPRRLILTGLRGAPTGSVHLP